MHPEAYAWVAGKVSEFDLRAERVIEVGSRNINGSIRPVFEPHAKAYIGVDVAEGSGVDVVADACTWRPDAPADLVVCMEVLEHCELAPMLIMSMFGMLRPGGILIITAAGPARAPHSAVDGGGLRSDEFYANIYDDELLDWAVMAGAEDVRVEFGRDRQDVYAFIVKPKEEG